MDSIDKKESSGPEGYQLNEIMQGIANIQNIANEVQGRNDIQERLELVREQANDTVYFVTEINKSQQNMAREK